MFGYEKKEAAIEAGIETALELRKLSWDELQSKRFALVAVQAVADEVYKKAYDAAASELKPVIDELQRRDQVSIDSAIAIERTKK